MPKFTTKVYYKSSQDLAVLKNLARMSLGPKGATLAPEDQLKQFVNDAVQQYANGILQYIKQSKAKAKEAENEGTTPGESGGATEETPERSVDSAALADQEEAAAENTPGHQ